jgi:hypothetical protein
MPPILIATLKSKKIQKIFYGINIIEYRWRTLPVCVCTVCFCFGQTDREEDFPAKREEGLPILETVSGKMLISCKR